MSHEYRTRMFAVLALCTALLSVPATAQRLFHIEEERIVDPDGTVFIAHGVNYQGPMFSWPDNPSVATSADKMRIWGFNTVRINWRVYDCPNGCANPCGSGVQWDQQRNAPIEIYIDEFVKKRNMVAIVDNHDYTCKSKVGSCINNPLIDFWSRMARAFGTQSSRTGKYNGGQSAVSLTDRQASMIWFDLRNEPLGSGTELFDALARDYEAVIEAIRATGARNIIVLEGSNWGRDYANTSWIKKWGPYFRDKYDNIVFSHHSYGWKNTDDLKAYYQWMTDHDLPMVIGECSEAEGGIEVTRANYGDESSTWATGGFSWNGASYEKGIGIVYWAFWGGDDADLCNEGGGHNITLSNGTPTNLSEEGRIVWADIRRGDKQWDPPCGGQGCGDLAACFTVGNTGLRTVTLDASCSRGAASYAWELGDGSTATGTLVEHSFEEDGAYEITLTVTAGEAADTRTVQAFVRGPVPVPGTVQAENWTAMGGVDTDTTTDDGGGRYLGWFGPGDWVDYALDVNETADLALDLRIATSKTGVKLALIIDGADTSVVDIPATGAYDAWQTVSTTVRLSRGVRTLRLTPIGDNLNVNWFRLSGAATFIERGGSIGPARRADKRVSLYGLDGRRIADGTEAGFRPPGVWIVRSEKAGARLGLRFRAQ